ncbi:uncharacterized protein V6R79_014819 [Siganus canaliculatus]
MPSSGVTHGYTVTHTRPGFHGRTDSFLYPQWERGAHVQPRILRLELCRKRRDTQSNWSIRMRAFLPPPPPPPPPKTKPP